MLSEVLKGSCLVSSPFLSTPSNKSECSFRSESIFEKESESFKYSDKSSSIIIGSSLWSSVPSIDMPTSENDLIGFLRSFDFENKIVGISSFNRFILKNQMNNNFLSSVLHSLEHFGIFNCNSCNRNLSNIWKIMHVTSMNWVNTFRSNRSYKNSDSAIFGSPTGSPYSVIWRIAISYPIMIITNNFSFNFIT